MLNTHTKTNKQKLANKSGGTLTAGTYFGSFTRRLTSASIKSFTLSDTVFCKSIENSIKEIQYGEIKYREIN
jgi:hypothetical protein